MTTQKEHASNVLESVRQGTASDFVRMLAEVLPKSAHGKIPEIERRTLEELDTPIGDSVELAGPTRAIQSTVEAYGLEIELDAGGLAVVLHSPVGFVS